MSVCTKSQPTTPSSSSVRVIRAPVEAPISSARPTTHGGGWSDAGATIRTSIPSSAPATSREQPTLNRASPT